MMTPILMMPAMGSTTTTSAPDAQPYADGVRTVAATIIRAGGRAAKRRTDRNHREIAMSDPTHMGQCAHKMMALFRAMGTREQAQTAQRFHDNGHASIAKALFSEMTRGVQ